MKRAIASMVLKASIVNHPIQYADVDMRHLSIPFEELRIVSNTTGVKYVVLHTCFGEWAILRTRLKKICAAMRRCRPEVRLTQENHVALPKRAYLHIDYTSPEESKGSYLLRSMDEPFYLGEVADIKFPQGGNKWTTKNNTQA